MTDNIRERFADIDRVSDALLLIASCDPANAGTVRITSGPMRAVLTFDGAHITSAELSNSGVRGVAALEKILRLEQAVFDFTPSDVPESELSEKLWLDPNELLVVALPLVEPIEDINVTIEVPAFLRQVSEEDTDDPNATVEVTLYRKPQQPPPAEAPKPPEKKPQKDPDALDMSEDALTAEQRALLETVALLKDKESFEQSAPEFDAAESELFLTEQKLGLLESVQVDGGPFSQAELKEVLEDRSGLTEEQKALLEISGKLADAESFHTSHVPIDLEDPTTVISDAERWIIEQNKNLLTPEQAKQEFMRDDLELAKSRAQSIEFKPFEEHAPLSGGLPSTADLDEIPTPDVTYEDYKTLDPIGVDPGKQRAKREAPKGLIGRASYVWGRLPAYSRTVRKQLMRPERIIGPIIFCGLTLGLFLLPAQLKKMFNESEAEALGIQHVRTTMADELDEEVPDAMNDVDVAGPIANEQGSTSGPAGGGGNYGGGDTAGGGGAGMAASDGALVQARTLAAQGWTKRAMALYRTYLALNPKAFKVRIELIRFLMNAKEKGSRMQARIECLEALKLHPPYELTQELAVLYQQVLTD